MEIWSELSRQVSRQLGRKMYQKNTDVIYLEEVLENKYGVHLGVEIMGNNGVMVNLTTVCGCFCYFELKHCGKVIFGKVIPTTFCLKV